MKAHAEIKMLLCELRSAPENALLVSAIEQSLPPQALTARMSLVQTTRMLVASAKLKELITAVLHDEKVALETVQRELEGQIQGEFDTDALELTYNLVVSLLEGL